MSIVHSPAGIIIPALAVVAPKTKAAEATAAVIFVFIIKSPKSLTILNIENVIRIIPLSKTQNQVFCYILLHYKQKFHFFVVKKQQIT